MEQRQLDFKDLAEIGTEVDRLHRGGYDKAGKLQRARLVAIGKGKANPVVQCNDKNRADLIRCLEPNRRVEVEQITVELRAR